MGQREIEGTIARNPGAARIPIAPMKAKRLGHKAHHADYCERCEHCVSAQGRTHQHRSTDKEDNTTAEFSLDYAFMTKDGQVESKEDIGDEVRLAGGAHRSLSTTSSRERSVGNDSGTQRSS